MKQLSLLGLLLCLLAGTGRAASISGTVLNAQSNPVANQIIHVWDSLTNFTAADTTDASGQYSIVLPALPLNDDVYARTSACGQSYTNYHVYTGTGITSNFSICGSTSAYALKGDAFLAGYPNSSLIRLYLIRKTYDSLAASWQLTAIDSFSTNSMGIFNKAYAQIPAGQLLLKAALMPGHPQYALGMPSYYTRVGTSGQWGPGSLSWSGAVTLNTADFTNSIGVPVILGTNPGGPGFIGGLVAQGANRGTAVGDPLNSRILLLTTAAGQAVAYTYSDAAGQFSFPNIAYGTYKIFGDAMGKLNPALTVTISAAQATVSDIKFEENNTQFKGHISSLGLGNSAALNAVSISPIPAADYVQLNGLNKVDGDKLVVLSGINGALISCQTFTQGQAVRIATASLPSGVYILHVQTASGSAQFKVVK